MKTIKKYLLPIICFVAFAALVGATVLAYFPVDYQRARARLVYLNSDLGRLGVEIEETGNKLNGKNEHTKYLEWRRDVDECEKVVKKYQTVCIVLGAGAAVALAGGVFGIIKINKKAKNPQAKQNISTTPHSMSAADELQKFKDLLDSGVITQEEFDSKKKQLLGL